MYVIYFGSKRYGNKKFNSYEAARSYARKLIRAGKLGFRWDGYTDYSDKHYNNPTLSHYNVSIKAV